MTITVRDTTHDPADVRIRVETDAGSLTLRWSFDETPRWPTPNYAEAAAVALVPYAQRTGSDLRILGMLSSSLLANLEDYRDYWVNLLPAIFRPISILADEIEDDAVIIDEGTAVVAFSGGVHSTYALVSDRLHAHDERTRKIVSAVFIRGLDGPFDSHNAASCKAICEALGTPLTVVSTNWRTAFVPHDSMSLMAGIAATLRLFAPVAGQGVVGATGTYGAIRRPSSSNPTSNAYLGDLSFPIRSAGFGTDRRTKVEAIGSHPKLQSHLMASDVTKGFDVIGGTSGPGDATS